MWNHYIDCFIAPLMNAHRDEAKQLFRTQLKAAFSGRSPKWFLRYPKDETNHITLSEEISNLLRSAANSYHRIHDSNDSTDDKKTRTDRLFNCVIHCIKEELTQRELPVMARRAPEESIFSGENRNSTIFFSDDRGTVSEPPHSPTP